MHTGMLLFDDSNIPLEKKIEKAADYYEKKYGFRPNICMIHPTMLETVKGMSRDKITVRPYRPVLPGHIWIGIEDKS